MSCSHSSTSSHPQYHHLLSCSRNTKHAGQDPINKAPKGIQATHGRTATRAAPHFNSEPSDRYLFEISPRSMHAGGTGARSFHSLPPVLVPHSRHYSVLSTNHWAWGPGHERYIHTRYQGKRTSDTQYLSSSRCTFHLSATRGVLPDRVDPCSP